MSRSKYKGPFFKVNLLKRRKWIKIKNKNLTILPAYNQRIVNVYNGKTFINLVISDKMVAFNISNEKTTEDLMSALCQMYEKPLASNKVFLMKRLFNIKMA